MSKDPNAPDGPSVVFGMLLGGFLGMVLTSLVWVAITVPISEFKREAIERNVAAYNSKTGEWQWIVEPTNERAERP